MMTPFPAISRRHAARLLSLAGLALVAAGPARAGSMLDPFAFASLGSFSGSGSDLYEFDSDALTLTQVGGSTVYHGVFSGGVAVFAFDHFELEAGGIIYGLGANPVAILSRSDMRVGGTIYVGHANTLSGPGGFGAGSGPGSGTPTLGSGGGGGYGGRGGAGGEFVTTYGGYFAQAGGAGGDTYGDLSDWLVGGSGGVASGANPQGITAGTGGGAIELGATGSISVSGLISAIGGSGYAFGGGGGAGGGVRMHASLIELSAAGVAIDASGGDGADVMNMGRSGIYGRGGGGGGGRVLLEADEILLSDFSVKLAGGSGHQNGEAGQLLLRYTAVPEPSSFILAGLAAGPALLARRLLRRS